MNYLWKSLIRDYARRNSATVPTSYLVRYVGILGANGNRVAQRTTMKLNHRVTIGPNASLTCSPTDLQKIIRHTQLGELGSTEVQQNQIG